MRNRGVLLIHNGRRGVGLVSVYFTKVKFNQPSKIQNTCLEMNQKYKKKYIILLTKREGESVKTFLCFLQGLL